MSGYCQPRWTPPHGRPESAAKEDAALTAVVNALPATLRREPDQTWRGIADALLRNLAAAGFRVVPVDPS